MADKELEPMVEVVVVEEMVVVVDEMVNVVVVEVMAYLLQLVAR